MNIIKKRTKEAFLKLILVKKKVFGPNLIQLQFYLFKPNIIHLFNTEKAQKLAQNPVH